jgi:hypothetical protein
VSWATSDRHDEHVPSREKQLEWLKQVCPSLSVTNELHGGERVIVLSFELDGRRCRLFSEDAGRVVLYVANGFRTRLRLPPWGVKSSRDAAEAAIVRASQMGDTKLEEHLSRELAMRNAGAVGSMVDRPRPDTPFRSQWSRPL